MFEVAFSLILTISNASIGPAVPTTLDSGEQSSSAKSFAQYAQPLAKFNDRLAGVSNSIKPWTVSGELTPEVMEWSETWKKLAAEKEKLKREGEDEHKKLARERKAREKRAGKKSE